MTDRGGEVASYELTGPLRTERLLLRPFTESDLDALHAYQSRRDVVRFVYWNERSRAEVHRALERKIAATTIRAEGDFLALAAELAATGAVVGDVVLGLISEQHRTGEIGFMVHPDHQGQGYAAEASRPLLRLAFEELRLHRVIGRLEARNIASARTLERLGMRREAHLVENEFVKGEWQSELVYAILDREWRLR